MTHYCRRCGRWRDLDAQALLCDQCMALWRIGARAQATKDNQRLPEVGG